MTSTLWAVGDSMTVGQGTSRTWWQRYADRRVGESAGASLIIGKGVGGTVVWHASPARDQIARWLPALLDATPAASRPSQILAMAGANNVHATATGDIPALLDAWEGLHTRLEVDYGIRTTWLQVPPFRAGSVYPAAWLPDLVARRNAMNTWLASAMGGRNRYVATAGPLTGADGYLRPECDSGDGLHVSTWAHVLIADAIPLSLDTL